MIQYIKNILNFLNNLLKNSLNIKDTIELIDIYNETGHTFIHSTINWKNISTCNLSEKFIEKYQDKLDWNSISMFRENLTEEFIEKYKDRLNWDKLSIYQPLPENILNKFFNELNLSLICKYQLLSENFIEKHKDEIIWPLISAYQILSESFIEKHKDKINFELLNINELYIKKKKNKDWFIGYIPKINIDKNLYVFSINKINLFRDSKFKVKIYYKDLIFTNETEKAKIIRKCNQYKIYGKKEYENISRYK